MGKTVLKMQMSITTMGLAGKETMSEEETKETSSCAGNVVQVFGFKNKFPEKLAIMEFPENLLCPSKRI